MKLNPKPKYSWTSSAMFEFKFVVYNLWLHILTYTNDRITGALNTYYKYVV